MLVKYRMKFWTSISTVIRFVRPGQARHSPQSIKTAWGVQPTLNEVYTTACPRWFLDTNVFVSGHGLAALEQRPHRHRQEEERHGQHHDRAAHAGFKTEAVVDFPAKALAAQARDQGQSDG